MTTYVALDLETTGLDLAQDRVTEVGAVRFNADGDVIETFSALVDPGQPIPRVIQEITGITDDDVAGAPKLIDVAGELATFVGAGPVIGHNIGFDLAFLKKEGVHLTAPGLDTAELSRVLMPDRQPRGLVELAQSLGIEPGAHHRALEDARTAAAIFVALHRKAGEIPAGLRLQLARLVSVQDLVLAEVIAGEGWQSLPASERSAPLIRPAPDLPSLTRREPPAPLLEAETAAAFQAAGAVIADFEERPEQLEMAAAVTRSLSDGGHWLIEAGTGVGKSMAYLVPAALYALRNGTRVVVSTNTINLQEQLLKHDIPAVRQTLRRAGVIADDTELRVSVLKGRSNYLCMRRWTASVYANLGDPGFTSLAASLLLWLPETETGDRSELSLGQDGWQAWPRFSALDADCLQRPNSFVREGNCFLQRARKAAESAHIIIVNHALLLADISAGGSVLPTYDHLIIDEAHNLEDTATRQFGGVVSARLVADALEGVHRPAGGGQREAGAATLLKALPEGAASDAGLRIAQAARDAVEQVAPLFAALARLIPQGTADDRLLVTRAVQAWPAWTETEVAWAPLDAALDRVHREGVGAASTIRQTGLVEEPDALAGELETAVGRVQDLRVLLGRLMGATDDQTITWLARERDRSASLNSAPLEVGPTLWDGLFSRKRTVVCTSATLAAAGSMTFAAQRLGLEDPETLALGSPFDYERTTLLAAVSDVPEPNAPDYNAAVARSIEELVLASEGRALALFTSHAALQAAATALRPVLEDSGITVLAQGVDGSPRQLTDHLRANPRSLILGTASFWEGVDIRGDALSLLIVPRLPFAVPTDPVHRARSERYDDPFGSYSLPSAILRFRQGFGRLIRHRDDRGAVVVLDRRIFEKKYGTDFVEALPRSARLKADLATVAGRVGEWLA